jgi:uncharacterized membrane protein
MTEYRVVVDSNAPPERVFAVLCDVERWPEWTATMTDVKRLDGGPFTVGSRVQVKQPKLSSAVWEVTELDERGFRWVARSPGVMTKAGHLVEANGDGSRITLSLQFSGFLGPLVARLYRNLCQRYLATEAEGLRKCAESSRV